MSSLSDESASAAILWEWEEELMNGDGRSFRSEAIVLHDTDFEIDPRYSPLDPDDKVILYNVSVHHLYIHSSNPDPQVPEDSFKNQSFDCSMLFEGHSSYGGGNSVSKVPNIPITLAKYLASWSFPTSFENALFKGLSDSANSILLTRPNQSQIMLRLRLHYVALQAPDEIDRKATQTRSRLYGFLRSHLYAGVHTEESEFPLFDHNMLNQSTATAHHPMIEQQGGETSASCCCGICFEDLTTASTTTPTSKLPCSHFYHYDCILPWLWKRGNNKCPTCNASYNTVGAVLGQSANLVPDTPWMSNMVRADMPWLAKKLPASFDSDSDNDSDMPN